MKKFGVLLVLVLIVLVVYYSGILSDEKLGDEIARVIQAMVDLLERGGEALAGLLKGRG